ncbi:MAG: sugar ABC transporter permease [Anaerolineae bacterium]|nr:sugar ABC transporter permease [Candidatus Roseilinea sp.]MDW8450081.1 sugar ABC transporter permease [Anaerolineae bacterium]
MRQTLQTSPAGSISAVTPPRRLRASKEARKNLVAYAFLAPWLLGLLIFSAGPILASAYLSFTRYDLLSAPEWTGLNNYIVMFTRDPRFAKALQVTANYVFVSVPLQLTLALAIAIVLNRGLRALSLYRAIYYLPSLLGGSVAIAILWRQVFGLDGLINQVLALVGIQGISWIGTPETAVYTLVLLRIWQFGSPMIIFLAGLKQIPREFYEAAEIDGAGRWSRFWRITIPLLTPIIFFNLVLQIISAFQTFTQAFIVSGGTGGPVNSTLFYTLYLYQQGFSAFNMGYASAMAWVLLGIVGGLTLVSFLSSKYWVYYES